ncbi:BrnA antitoxin family protein [soil metagenome]
MPRKPNPELIDDEAPEATDEWFAKALPAGAVLPRLVGAGAAAELLKPKRGRPVLANPKQHVNIRLDADVLTALKRTGSGWQTRLNDVLREWLRTQA